MEEIKSSGRLRVSKIGEINSVGISARKLKSEKKYEVSIELEIF